MHVQQRSMHTHSCTDPHHDRLLSGTAAVVPHARRHLDDALCFGRDPVALLL